MKKIVAVLLVVTLSFSTVCCSFAEEEKSGGFFDSIGSFFSDTWNDTTNWISGAWGDAGEWISGAWGDASQWIGQAWDDSSGWVADIWGDVSTWATGTYNDASGAVSTWWINTFNKVTDNTQNAWEWLKSTAKSYSSEGKELISEVKTAIASAGADAEEKVYAVFHKILLKFNLTEVDIGKVWSTIKAYAEQKGIPVVLAEKIVLPYLLQLIEDQPAETIPAIAISQYLTGVIEKLGIDAQDAETFIEELGAVLGEI